MHKFILAFLALSAAVSIVSISDAATYRNDGDNTIIVINSAAQPQAVRPGASIATIYVPTDGDMTKTAETPYYNPIVARHAVTSTGAADDQTVTLVPGSATHLKIWKVAGGTVSVFYEATGNTPAVAILREGDQFVHDSGGKIAQLVMQFDAAGTCEVLETNETIE